MVRRLISKISAVFALTLTGGLLLAAPAALTPVAAYAASPAYVADSVQDACAGIDLGGGGNCKSDGGKLTGLVRDIIGLLSIIVGIAAVIMIIIGGLKYITSGGDSSKVSGAKSTIVYAIVGLIVASLAQVIVHFVLSKTT
jgi:hypothetical protein